MPGYANNHSKLNRKRSRSRSGGYDSKHDDLQYVDDESELSSVDERMNGSDFEAHNNTASPRQSTAQQHEVPHPRKRGRPKASHSSASPAPIKEEPTGDKSSQHHAYGSSAASTATAGTNGYESDKDETGETKVDKYGRLQGGREYRVPTFTLPTRDDTLFMFSKDPAALLGFRDSFVFLKKNAKLQKVHIDNEEKGYLVDSNLLRSTFRTREISVVTARSVFKQFGHRIVKRGRKGRDDYYYTGEVDEGDDVHSDDDYYSSSYYDHHGNVNRPIPASTFIQPNHHYHHHSSHHSSSISSTAGPNSITAGSNNDYGRNGLANKLSFLDTQPTDLNWLHAAAVSIRQFNSSLVSYRRNNPTSYDLLTNVYQIPANRQTLRDPTLLNSSSNKPTNNNGNSTNVNTLPSSPTMDPLQHQNMSNITAAPSNISTSVGAVPSTNLNPMTVASNMHMTAPNIQQ